MNNLDCQSISYLNLEISQASRTVISSDKHKFKCSFYKETYKHIFHSGNSQLNSIVDLIINLGRNLEHNQNKNISLWQSIHDFMRKKNKVIHDLEDKLEYLKTTFSLFEEKLINFERKVELLIFHHKSLKTNNLLSKEDIKDLILITVESKKKEIEFQSRDLLKEIQIQVFENTRIFKEQTEGIKLQLLQLEKLALN